MRWYTLILFIVCAMVSLNRGSVYAEFTFSTGMRADWVSEKESTGIDGTETTIPVGVAYEDSQWKISLETAYSSAAVDADNAASNGDLSHKMTCLKAAV